MFWPTDYAINNLPVDFQNKLRDPQRVLELIHFIQYHVVAHIQVRARGMFYRKQTTTFIFKVVPCKTMSRRVFGHVKMIKSTTLESFEACMIFSHCPQGTVDRF